MMMGCGIQCSIYVNLILYPQLIAIYIQKAKMEPQFVIKGVSRLLDSICRGHLSFWGCGWCGSWVLGERISTVLHFCV